MKPIPKITDTEWEVMRVVWAKHPITAAEIIAHLSASDPSWHPKTVRTLLARLVQKQALGYEPQDRSYVYQPLVLERECLDAVSESFLARFFGGSMKPMLAHFVERQKLTEQHLHELEQLLEQSKDRPVSKRRKHGSR